LANQMLINPLFIVFLNRDLTINIDVLKFPFDF
jgi:hypothetical protein